MAFIDDSLSLPRKVFWHLYDRRFFLAAFFASLPALHYLISQYVPASRRILSTLSFGILAPYWVQSAAIFYAFLTTLFVVFWIRSKGYSKLNPGSTNALFLQVDKPNHLRGREGDIARLLRLCRENELVFLYGDSGSGKTALLRAGLIPALEDKEDSPLLPLYLKSWGADWKSGPHFELADALRRALEKRPALCRIIQLQEPITSRIVFPVLNDLLRVNCIPLIIFDQLDDYLARYKSMLHTDGGPINAAELCAKNDFWAEIRRLLIGHAIHCLFAIRTDRSPGLLTVHFLPQHEVHDVVRLDAGSIEPLLNDLTKAGHEKQPIILNPQRGWDELRQRLARDLTVDNGVLPMQLNLALRGLEQLRFLTVAEYRRIGGLAGLEVAHLRNHVRKSAHKNGFSERTLIFFLRQLVNPADQNKTIECSIEQVLRAVPVEGITAEQTTRAFEHLRQVTIVKKVPLSEAEARWSLEHDYLCRVIENAARLVDPGTQEAQQWHETYNATSEVASLKVLLTGWSWSVFVALFQRRIQHALIRRFVRRGFAAVLTALLIATSMTCTIAFLFWQKYTVTQEVNKLLYGQSGQEIQTLARSSESVRHMYVRSALEKELLASSLTSWQDRRRALLGIDPSRRDSLFKQVISGCAYFDWSKTLLTSTMRDIQSKRPKCGLFAYEMLLPYELLNLEPGIALGRLLSISGARQCFSSRGIDDDWAALDRRLDTGMAREIGRAAENIAEADRSQWIWAALRHLEDFQQQHAICSERSHVAILRFLQSSITALKQEDTVSAYKQLARYGEIDRVASNNNLALLGEVFTKLAARLSEQQAMDLLTSLLVEREGVAATGVLTWRASSAALSVLIQKAPYRERSRILLLSISHIAENVDDSVPVHQDLIKTLITGLNKDDLLDAYYRFSKRLDQEYAEDQHPLHLLDVIRTIAERMPDDIKIAAMRTLVELVVHRNKQEVGFKYVYPIRYTQIVSIGGILARLSTQEMRNKFVAAWKPIYLSELAEFKDGIVRKSKPSATLPAYARYRWMPSRIVEIENILLAASKEPYKDWTPPTIDPDIEDAFISLIELYGIELSQGRTIEDRLQFLGNLVPLSTRQIFYERVSQTTKRPVLNWATGYDGLSRTQCHNLSALILYALRAFETPGASDAYGVLNLSCIETIEENDARLVLDKIFSQRPEPQAFFIPTDNMLDMLLRRANCDGIICMEKVRHLQQNVTSGRPLTLAVDAISGASQGMYWHKSWKRLLDNESKSKILSFIEARIDELPTAAARSLSPEARFRYDRDFPILFAIMQNSAVDLSASPRIADFCAQQARVEKIHDSNRALFLRCMGREHTSALLETVYPALIEGRRGFRDIPISRLSLLRYLQPLPNTRQWIQRYIDLFKEPYFDELEREVLLGRLEEIAGVKFDSDPWKLAVWAKGNGYDIETPLQVMEQRK